MAYANLSRVSAVSVSKLLGHSLPDFCLVWVLDAAGDGGDGGTERWWALWKAGVWIVHTAERLGRLQVTENRLLCERVVQRVAHRAWDGVGRRWDRS